MRPPNARQGFGTVYGGLRVDVREAQPDVFQFDVRPAPSGAAVPPPPGLQGCAGSVVVFNPQNGTFAIQYRGRALWWGRVSRVDSCGRLGLPGLETSWRATEGEGLYGLGERFDALNRHGRRVEMWNADVPGQAGSNSCCNIPCVLSTRGYALFAADNPEGAFDLNAAGDGFCRYVRTGQEMTFWVAAGDDLSDLIRERTAVQGAPAGIPSWAWGPWLSRDSFENQAAAEEVVLGMIKRELPVAAVVLEAWKGEAGNSEANAFSSGHWPRLDAYLELCRRNGIRNMLWQAPCLPPESPEYEEFHRLGYFVRRPDGSPSRRGGRLNGFADIDFTNPRAVAAWKDLARAALRRGIGGFKVDDGEDVKPDDVFADGRRGWQVHNEYAVLYQNALRQLLREERIDGMLWSRSGSTGSPGVPALRAGDRRATWAEMRSLVPAGLSAGLSGIVFWGHDIGGCFGDPSPELYIRWLQFGALSPLMQYHGVSRREPWDFGDVAEDAYRLLVALRMNLRPTLEDLADEACRSGLPIMRPMILQYPGDAAFVNEDGEYMLGPDLLVAPVCEPDAAGRTIRFPSGVWHHALSPMAFEGPAPFEVPIGLVDAPLFLREGAALRVQMARDAAFGQWSAKDPVRRVKVESGRSAVHNLRAPLTGSVLDGKAVIEFRIDPDWAGGVTGVWHFADAPADRYPAMVQTNGEAVRMDLSPAADASLLNRRQVYVILGRRRDGGDRELLRGEIRWQSPVAMQTQVTGSAVADEDRREIVVCLTNRTDKAVDVLVKAGAARGVRVRPSEQAGMVLPAGSVTLSWKAEFAATNAVGETSVEFALKAADALLDRRTLAFVRLPRWVVVGPFAVGPLRSHCTPLAPEWHESPSVAFEAAGGAVRWVTLDERHWPERGCLDFGALYGRLQGAIGYAMTRIWSDAERTVELRFRTDESLEVWVNGERLHSTDRGAEGDEEDVVTARLAQGVNTVLVKVGHEAGEWQLRCRVTALDERPAEGLRDGFADFRQFAAARAASKDISSHIRPFAWQVLGPVPGPPRSEDEWKLELDRMAGSQVWPPPVKEHTWRTVAESAARDNLIDLRAVLGPASRAVAYAATSVCVARRTPVSIVGGSDDGIVVWVNGKEVWSAPESRQFAYAADEAPATLEPGTNRILCRVSQGGGDWKFQMNLYDAAHSPPRPVVDEGR